MRCRGPVPVPALTAACRPGGWCVCKRKPVVQKWRRRAADVRRLSRRLGAPLERESHLEVCTVTHAKNGP